MSLFEMVCLINIYAGRLRSVNVVEFDCRDC
jgi:hypothetical protein